MTSVADQIAEKQYCVEPDNEAAFSKIVVCVARVACETYYLALLCSNGCPGGRQFSSGPSSLTGDTLCCCKNFGVVQNLNDVRIGVIAMTFSAGMIRK